MGNYVFKYKLKHAFWSTFVASKEGKKKFYTCSDQSEREDLHTMATGICKTPSKGWTVEEYSFLSLRQEMLISIISPVTCNWKPSLGKYAGQKYILFYFNCEFYILSLWYPLFNLESGGVSAWHFCNMLLVPYLKPLKYTTLCCFHSPSISREVFYSDGYMFFETWFETISFLRWALFPCSLVLVELQPHICMTPKVPRKPLTQSPLCGTSLSPGERD